MPKLPKNPFKGIKLLESTKIPTPFGTVETPGIEIPPLKIPKLEGRHRKALGHAIGVDASDLIALIPYAGGVLADSIRAMHTGEIKKLLTPEEYDKYMKWDKIYPDTLALLRSRIGI